MLVECPGCKAKYRIDEQKIPSRGITIPCKKCKTNLILQGDIRKSGHLHKKCEERTSGTLAELKAESFKYSRDSKDKLPIEVFVRTAIEKLREPPAKGIRMVHSGFADAFKEYYCMDPVAELAKLTKEGKFGTKLEEDDTVIYLPADAPISGTLTRILDPSPTSDQETTEQPRGHGLAQDPAKESTIENSRGDNLGVQRTFCEDCGTDISNVPSGITACWHCGSAIPKSLLEQKAFQSEENNSTVGPWGRWFFRFSIRFAFLFGGMFIMNFVTAFIPGLRMFSKWGLICQLPLLVFFYMLPCKIWTGSWTQTITTARGDARQESNMQVLSGFGLYHSSIAAQGKRLETQRGQNSGYNPVGKRTDER